MESTAVELRRAREDDSFAAFAVRRRAIVSLRSPGLTRAEADAWATAVSLGRLSRIFAEHEVWVATNPEILLEANWTAVSFYEDRGYRRAYETRPNEPVVLTKEPEIRSSGSAVGPATG